MRSSTERAMPDWEMISDVGSDVSRYSFTSAAPFASPGAEPEPARRPAAFEQWWPEMATEMICSMYGPMEARRALLRKLVPVLDSNHMHEPTMVPRMQSAELQDYHAANAHRVRLYNARLASMGSVWIEAVDACDARIREARRASEERALAVAAHASLMREKANRTLYRGKLLTPATSRRIAEVIAEEEEASKERSARELLSQIDLIRYKTLQDAHARLNPAPLHRDEHDRRIAEMAQELSHRDPMGLQWISSLAEAEMRNVERDQFAELKRICTERWQECLASGA